MEKEYREQGWRINESLEEFQQHQLREEKWREVDGRPGAMPWLLVKENRLCPRVSEKSLLLLLLLFLLMVFLGKDDRSVRPVPLPNGGA